MIVCIIQTSRWTTFGWTPSSSKRQAYPGEQSGRLVLGGQDHRAVRQGPDVNRLP